jgi:mono/diheme cytochrome c family protein
MSDDLEPVFGEGKELGEDGVELTLEQERGGGQSDKSTCRTLTDIFLIFAVICLFFAGAAYLQMYDGGWKASEMNPSTKVALTASGGSAEGGFAAKAPETFEEAGKRVYAQVCQACHQANGQGLPGSFPPLAGSEWVSGGSERGINIVLSGLSGPITVKGTSYNGAMAAFGGMLSDMEVAAVLTHVRSQWGNSGVAVTEEAVAAVREAHGKHGTWTGDELLKLYPLE